MTKANQTHEAFARGAREAAEWIAENPDGAEEWREFAHSMANQMMGVFGADKVANDWGIDEPIGSDGYLSQHYINCLRAFDRGFCSVLQPAAWGEDTIVQGIAECLWCCAWADHADGSGCTGLSGVQIDEIAPATGADAFAHASSIAEAVCKASGATSLHSLLAKLLNAEGVQESHHKEYSSRFGWCLGHMAIGNGVSWFDDHPDSADLVVPSLDFCLENAVTRACGCQDPK